MIKQKRIVWKLIVANLFLLGMLNATEAFSKNLSSLSFQTDTNTNCRIEGKITTVSGDPISNVDVYAVDKNCGKSTTGNSATTDIGGKYAIVNLQPGTYYLSTDTRYKETEPVGYYINEFWDGDNGTLECKKAQSVTLNAGQTVYNINFSLDEGARIEGVITDSAGIPLENVCVYTHSTTCNGNYWLRADDQTDSNGRYTISGVPTGTCYITADTSCRGKASETFYVKGFWDGVQGTTICENAFPLTLGKKQVVSDINILLKEGGLVSGQVMTDTGKPLGDACIRINNKKCTEGDWYGEGLITDSTGNYSFAVPAGTYYINTNASCSDNDTTVEYTNEFWDGDQGTIDCYKAEAVTVILKQDTSGINFSLQENYSSSTTTTTIYLPPPDECAIDSDCNDGLFCNGDETCVNGACVNGDSPCTQDETCIEDLLECRVYEKMEVPAIIKKIYTPMILDKQCPWLAFIDETENDFDYLTSVVRIIGAGTNYQGVNLDVSRNTFKIGMYIFVPVCIEQDASPGQWTVEIETDTQIADKLYRYVIEGNIEVVQPESLTLF